MSTGENFRLAVATRGFRGGGSGGGKFYINETVDLQDLSITTSIELSTTTVDIDLGVLSVDISSNTISVGVSSYPEITVDTVIDSVTIEVDEC